MTTPYIRGVMFQLRPSNVNMLIFLISSSESRVDYKVITVLLLFFHHLFTVKCQNLLILKDFSIIKLSFWN